MYYQADMITKAILSVILQCVIAHIYCKCFHCFFFLFFLDLSPHWFDWLESLWVL